MTEAVKRKRGRPPRPQFIGYDWSTLPPVFVNLFERMLQRPAAKIARKHAPALDYLVREYAPPGDRTVRERAAWLKTAMVGMVLQAIERWSTKAKQKSDPEWPGALTETRARELVWAGAVIAFQRTPVKFKRAVVAELAPVPTILSRSRFGPLRGSALWEGR